jgi:ribosome maturation factor RimP
MGGHYTLEVTSPGLERSLRTPVHFQKSIGKTVALRLRDIVTPDGERSERRLQGVLIAADEQSATIQLNDAALTERVVPYDKIDRARTVFVWGPAPKPGKAPSATKKKVAETSRERRAEKRSGMQANKKAGGDTQ